jgi:hypothetical protein
MSIVTVPRLTSPALASQLFPTQPRLFNMPHGSAHEATTKVARHNSSARFS